MKFKFRDKYESATEWAAETVNQAIETATNAAFIVYDFSKKMETREGRQENWENVKKKSADLRKIVIKELKVVWKDIADNWEAAIILTFSSIGLAHIFGTIPGFIKLPSFFEAPMVAPVIAVLIILLLVTLIEIKIKGAKDEVVGERAR